MIAIKHVSSHEADYQHAANSLAHAHAYAHTPPRSDTVSKVTPSRRLDGAGAGAGGLARPLGVPRPCVDVASGAGPGVGPDAGPSSTGKRDHYKAPAHATITRHKGKLQKNSICYPWYGCFSWEKVVWGRRGQQLESTLGARGHYDARAPAALASRHRQLS